MHAQRTVQQLMQLGRRATAPTILQLLAHSVPNAPCAKELASLTRCSSCFAAPQQLARAEHNSTQRQLLQTKQRTSAPGMRLSSPAAGHSHHAIICRSASTLSPHPAASGASDPSVKIGHFKARMLEVLYWVSAACDSVEHAMPRDAIKTDSTSCQSDADACRCGWRS